jgi:hypothetical protein
MIHIERHWWDGEKLVVEQIDPADFYAPPPAVNEPGTNDRNSDITRTERNREG